MQGDVSERYFLIFAILDSFPILLGKLSSRMRLFLSQKVVNSFHYEFFATIVKLLGTLFWRSFFIFTCFFKWITEIVWNVNSLWRVQAYTCQTFLMMSFFFSKIWRRYHWKRFLLSFLWEELICIHWIVNKVCLLSYFSPLTSIYFLFGSLSVCFLIFLCRHIRNNLLIL